MLDDNERDLLASAARLCNRTQELAAAADELRHEVLRVTAELETLRLETIAARTAQRPPLP